MTSPHLARPATDTYPYPPSWLLCGGRPLARWIVRRRYQVQLHGAASVPIDGPVIFASNHVGVIDGPLLAIFAPRAVHALTKVEMFHGFLGRVLMSAGQVPLDRFQTDPAAVKTSVAVLRGGGAVGIFPEGARGAGNFERFHRGAAYLALVTGAPIVPVLMFGTREPGAGMSSLPRQGAPLDLVFGETFTVDATSWPRTRQHVGDTSRLLRARMLALLDDTVRSTNLRLPGPLPAGQHERDPGGGVTEKSA